MTHYYGSAVMCDGKAILISGNSGSGKSDLTLRFLSDFAPHLFEVQAQPFKTGHACPSQEQSCHHKFGFISDDQVLLERGKNDIIASAPETISGLLEVRGIGIIKLPICSKVPVSIILKLSASKIPRFLDEAPMHEVLLGQSIPVIALNPFEQAAPLKMKIALELYGL